MHKYKIHNPLFELRLVALNYCMMEENRPEITVATFGTAELNENFKKDHGTYRGLFLHHNTMMTSNKMKIKYLLTYFHIFCIGDEE